VPRVTDVSVYVRTLAAVSPIWAKPVQEFPAHRSTRKSVSLLELSVQVRVTRPVVADAFNRLGAAGGTAGGAGVVADAVSE
jgi:hypothetical protein